MGSNDNDQPLYPYVGPAHILRAIQSSPPGAVITNSAELEAYLEIQDAGPDITLTFVVDRQGLLRLADRRSEHVACASQQPVLSAGELRLCLEQDHWKIESITNQSTGYCPEPRSYPAVARALEQAGLQPPPHFTHRFDFRRCPSCQQLAIIKEQWFHCLHCQKPLPHDYNVAPLGSD